MRATALRVALLGCGVVGSEVVRLLHEQHDDLAARVGAPLELVGIAVRRPQRARDLPVDPSLFTADAAALVARDDVDIVVEVVGGIEPVRSLAAVGHGVAARAWSRPTRRCWPTGRRDAARQAAEATASTSTTRRASPVRSRCCGRCARALSATASPACSGIVNGTTNYILTRMDETGAGFAEALEEATALGYAEADPTADVDGLRRGLQGGDPRRTRLPHAG